MSTVLHDIWTGLTTASPLDQVNLVLGITGVVLMIRRSLWAFPIGLVAVVVQGVLFYQARYYADATVQIFFFGALVYGWWHWTHAAGQAAELPVTVLSVRGRWLGLAITGIGTVGWAVVLRQYTDAIMPFRDAFIATFSVAAQILQSRKQIENWPVWVVVNVTAIAAYWVGGLYYTAVLYAVYLGLSFAGWKAWRAAMRTGAGV